MDEQPGRQQDAGTPRYAPDGRSWWNGREWPPVSQQISQPASAGQRIRPGRRLYLVAGLTLVLSVALVVHAGSLSFGPPESPTRVTAPGTTEIMLAEPGAYTISYEHQRAGHEPLNSIPSEVSSMHLGLTSTTASAPVFIHALAGDSVYSAGSTVDVAIAEFNVDHPGTYALSSSYSNGQSGQPVVLRVARGSPEDPIVALLFIFGAGASLLAALAIGAVTFVLRIRSGIQLRRAHTRAARYVLAAGQPGAIKAGFDPTTIRSSLDRVDMLSQQDLPEEVRAGVAAIRQEILELLPHASRFPRGSRDLFVLQRTATEYLPTSVEAYLALPATYAAAVVLQDGKTALQILRDQLDLLNVEVAEIGDAVRRGDSERLLIHGRFLEATFGRKPNDLGLPPSE
jgi:hypothetical protein